MESIQHTEEEEEELHLPWVHSSCNPPPPRHPQFRLGSKQAILLLCSALFSWQDGSAPIRAPNSPGALCTYRAECKPTAGSEGFGSDPRLCTMCWWLLSWPKRSIATKQ